MTLDPAVQTQIQVTFERQRERRWTVSQRSAAERVAVLRRLRAAVVAHRGEVAQALMSDFKKPPTEVELTEIHPVLEEIDFAIDNLADWMRPEPAPGTLMLAGTRSEVRREAKGVVLILAPWNYPFNLLVAPLVSALAAGNCVLLKPSEKTPATARVLAALVAEIFDSAEVALFEGGAEVAEALLALPVDHVFFTGSTAVGKKVMTAAAQHLASVTLELGGKSPVIVDRSADLAAAAGRIVWGRFVNGGQTCIAPDYVWVHESQERALTDALVESLKQAYGESEADRRASPDLARIIDEAALDRLQRLTEQTIAGGAVVELGGTFDRAERYVAPTVLTNVGIDSPIMGEEIFGPILPIVRYRSLDEVFPVIERKGKPLALYLFARDAKVTEEVFARTSAGATVLNNVVLHFVNPNIPFGGVGPSGMGSSHGVFGFRAFSHERAVLAQRWPAMVQLLFPPYRTRRAELMARFAKLME